MKNWRLWMTKVTSKTHCLKLVSYSPKYSQFDVDDSLRLNYFTHSWHWETSAYGGICRPRETAPCKRQLPLYWGICGENWPRECLHPLFICHLPPSPSSWWSLTTTRHTRTAGDRKTSRKTDTPTSQPVRIISVQCQLCLMMLPTRWPLSSEAGGDTRRSGVWLHQCQLHWCKKHTS